MIWRALQFDWPGAAWLLFLVFPLSWAFYYLYAHRQKQLENFASQRILDLIVEKRDPLVYWVKAFLFSLAWVLIVFALMQPKGNERYAPSNTNASQQSSSGKAIMRKKTHEVIFLVDASASMSVVDNQGKTRLELSKEIVDDVIRQLQGENVSLYAFTSATIQVVPSTLDYIFTRLMLQQIAINEGETEGTNLKQALEYLHKRYFETNLSKTKTVVVLTDGGDTSLEGVPLDKQKESIEKIISPIADVKDQDVRVFVVGLGTAQGKPIPKVTFEGHPVVSALEESLLQRLSVAGRGELYLADKMPPLQISQEIARQIARRESYEDSSTIASAESAGGGTHVYDYYFQFPLAAAILCLMAYMLIPDTHKRKNDGGLP